MFAKSAPARISPSTPSVRSRASAISSGDAPSGTAIRMCPMWYSLSAPWFSIVER